MKTFMIIAFVAFSTVTFAQSKASSSDVSKEVAALKTDKDADDNVLIFPAFQGGKKAMLKFIAQNLDYPDLAKENGIEGVVVVQFYIADDGSIERASIDRSLGYGCDEAALKVVEDMPYWSPARFRGKNITKKVKLPITFSLR